MWSDRSCSTALSTPPIRERSFPFLDPGGRERRLDAASALGPRGVRLRRARRGVRREGGDLPATALPARHGDRGCGDAGIGAYPGFRREDARAYPRSRDRVGPSHPVGSRRSARAARGSFEAGLRPDGSARGSAMLRSVRPRRACLAGGFSKSRRRSPPGLRRAPSGPRAAGLGGAARRDVRRSDDLGASRSRPGVDPQESACCGPAHGRAPRRAGPPAPRSAPGHGLEGVAAHRGPARPLPAGPRARTRRHTQPDSPLPGLVPASGVRPVVARVAVHSRCGVRCLQGADPHRPASDRSRRRVPPAPEPEENPCSPASPTGSRS